jgi:hypothetical protein
MTPACHSWSGVKEAQAASAFQPAIANRANGDLALNSASNANRRISQRPAAGPLGMPGIILLQKSSLATCLKGDDAAGGTPAAAASCGPTQSQRAKVRQSASARSGNSPGLSSRPIAHEQNSGAFRARFVAMQTSIGGQSVVPWLERGRYGGPYQPRLRIDVARPGKAA